MSYKTIRFRYNYPHFILLIFFFNIFIAGFSLNKYEINKTLTLRFGNIIQDSLSKKTQIIQNVWNYKVLDLLGSINQDSALISIWNWNNGLNQAWLFEKFDKGWVIKSELSKKVLTFSRKDSLIIQQSFNGNSNQYWKMIPYKPFYRIKNMQTGLYLTIGNDKLQLKNLIEKRNQLWQLHKYIENIDNPRNEKILSLNEMREDIDFFINRAKIIHPNPFAYTSEKTFRKKVEILFRFVKNPKTVSEYFKLIAPIINSSFDGHTYVEPFNLFTEQMANCSFPYNVKIENGRLLAYQLSDSFLINKKPLEIESINSNSSVNIIKGALQFFPYENPKMKEKVVEDCFPYILELFDIKEPYNIVFSNSNNDYISVNCSFNKRFNKLIEKIEPYKFTFYQEKQFGILKLNTFEMSNESELNFKAFLDSSFKVLKRNHCPKLVIDITNNLGGNSFIAQEVLDYISMQNISYLENTFIKKINQKQNDIIFIKTLRNGSIINYYNREIKQEHDGFSGKVYLMQSSYTYSAAVSLSYLFYLSGRGKIIGEETGGYINCYIESQSFKLPNSNIPAKVSDKKCQVSPTFEKGGVKPDLYCNINYKELLSIENVEKLILEADTVAISRRKELYNDSFYENFIILEKDRNISWNEGNYLKAINSLHIFEEKYLKLDSKHRQCYQLEIAITYYNLACAYSLLKNCETSLKYLQKANIAGYKKYDWILKDSDLENLRNTKQFVRYFAKILNK